MAPKNESWADIAAHNVPKGDHGAVPPPELLVVPEQSQERPVSPNADDLVEDKVHGELGSSWACAALPCVCCALRGELCDFGVNCGMRVIDADPPPPRRLTPRRDCRARTDSH